MATYSAYGLTIDSELCFPELPAGTSLPDFIIRRATVELPPGMSNGDRRAWADDSTAYLFCRNRGAMRIQAGREIVIEITPGADERIVRNWVLGRGFGVAMFQRGFLVLHASVVRCGDSGVAFVGASGAGKSTLAMAFCREGDHVLEDDHAIIAEGMTPVVLPGSPQLRLRGDSMRSLESSNGPVACAWVSEEKLGWDVRRHFAPSPVPLRQIYVITDSDRYHITPLTAREAGTELAQHSFLSHLLVRAEHTMAHHERCKALASRTTVHRLERPRALSDLDRLVQTLRNSWEATPAFA
jgi:hypothetical protein